MLRRIVVPALAIWATALAACSSSPADHVTMDMVRVGDTGNADDFTGFGAVPTSFSIGRFEVTNGQYASFLNAVAADDPYGLYSPDMAVDPNVAGISRSGNPGSYTYAAMDDSADRPVTFVSWFDAARLANWMANDQPNGRAGPTTTEDGAYPLDGKVNGPAPKVNATNPNTADPPRYRLPTEDEWYKAAYYDPSIAQQDGIRAPGRNAINPNTGAPPLFSLPTESQWYKAAYHDPTHKGGYWDYATASDDLPGNVPGDRPNQANYDKGTFAFTQSADFTLTQNYLTDVGAFSASTSHYGTYDQNGNLFEWNDLDGRASYAKGFRGGSWQNIGTESDMSRYSGLEYDPLSASDVVTFRLAAPTGGRRPVTTSRHVARVSMPMVTVGNPGNSPDPATGGRLGDEREAFRIGKHEVTIAQYAAFLNAVAKDDPNGLYNVRLERVGNLAGISRAGEPGKYRYAVMDNSGNSGNRPVGFVSWYDAARFANWMANGQPVGAQVPATTEDGAYTLSSSRMSPVDLPAPSPKPGTGGYWLYSTQSNETPGNVPGSQPNQVNYANAEGQMATTQQLGIEPDQNYLTDVGAFTASESHYGTFDQLGNVYEWNDLAGQPGVARGIRGSCWFGSLVYAMDIAKNDRALSLATDNSTSIGIRLAGP